jgi:hypothetical protein
MKTRFVDENGVITESEVITFRQLVEKGLLKPGQRIQLMGANASVETIIVGNCTPYHQPTVNDAGVGWRSSHPRMDLMVLQVLQM